MRCCARCAELLSDDVRSATAARAFLVGPVIPVTLRSRQAFTVTQAEAGTRLDRWLAAPERLGSRSRALQALHRGKIFVDEVERSAADAGMRLVAGQAIRIWIDRPGSARRRYARRQSGGLDLLYEDAALIVVNKPAGLLTVPLPAQPHQPSLLQHLERHLASDRNRQPLAVHRIDRDTSGVVLFAKTPAAQVALKEQFAARRPQRIYLAVLDGVLAPSTGEWRQHVRWDAQALRLTLSDSPSAHQAISHYRVLERFATRACLVEVALVSGRRNQIRLQAQLAGHPLVGERQYITRRTAPGLSFARQALHAARLGFDHPDDGRPVDYEAPLPQDLERLLLWLRRLAIAR